MSAGILIVGMCVGVIGLVISVHIIKIGYRRSQFKSWEVGDYIVLTNNSGLHKLVGWSDSAVYIENKSGSTEKMGWEKFEYNKSAIWRENYDSCERSMGRKPGFTRGLMTNSAFSSKIAGKPIDLLTEVECEVYLKMCLKKEDYETAELIKKRMEKFR